MSYDKVLRKMKASEDRGFREFDTQRKIERKAKTESKRFNILM